MTDQIRTPWTPDQVAALNEFQRRGGMHPFTCGADHVGAAPVLIAREDGWHCPGTFRETCGYRQDWAHAFMADQGAWPRFPFGERHGPTPGEVAAALEQSLRTTVNNPPASEDAASDQLRQRIVESLDNYPVACWTSRNLAGRVTGVVGSELDQWEKAAREASDRLTRVRKALASFDGRGVIAPGHVNLDVPTAGEVLDKIREALDGPPGNGTAGFVPATPKHFADMPRTDADPLVIEPYRNDQNQPRWAFRCWGTDACDGWLSLELTSKRWAEVDRDRHIAEAHPELAATEATHDAGPSVREAAADDRRWFDGEREGE